MLWNEINNDHEFRLTMLWKITAQRMTEEIWTEIYLALFLVHNLSWYLHFFISTPFKSCFIVLLGWAKQHRTCCLWFYRSTTVIPKLFFVLFALFPFDSCYSITFPYYRITIIHF